MTKETTLQEIELTFGEKKFRVRPDFETITRIEDALAQPSRTLGLKCYAAVQSQRWRSDNGVTEEISLKEMAAIMYCLLANKDGAPDNVSASGEVLMDYGYDGLLMPVAGFLTRAKRGHKEHEREAKLANEKAEREREAGVVAAADPPES